MRITRITAMLALSVGLLLNSGCLVKFVTPKTAALSQVHETYRADFAAQAVPPASAAPTAPASPPTAFSKSLQAIRDYRLKYPGDSQELAHLKVLEGMIYLQSGRFGLAEAVSDEVVAAGARLSSGTGRTVRDQLFAQNFKTLIKGWSETRKPNGRQWKVFADTADELAANLEEVPIKKLADPDSDQGALYLATTAAIFYVWAYSELAVVDPQGAPARKTVWFTKARDLIGRHLDGSLSTSTASKDLGQAPEGILRFVEWYHWLDRNR